MANHSIIEEDLGTIITGQLPWEKLDGKSILITGANGFLPAYMVETLLYLNEKIFRKPAKIFALVRDKERALRRFENCGRATGLSFIVQDVCAPLSIEGRIDFVIHAASQASPKYFGADPVGTLNANVLGTHHVLKLAHEKHVEGFLFFSSGEVYGQVAEQDIPVTETAYGYLDPTDIRSCYAESKRMGETMCVSWFRQFELPVKIVRPFHTYGPGMKLDDGRVFADFVADVVNRRDIVMKSEGAARRAFCYLADATGGFFTVLLKGEYGQPYNVGNPDAEVSIAELAGILTRIFPERKLEVIKKMGDRGVNYLESPISRNSPDITRAKSLGWMPHTSVSEGFQRTVRSFE
jgi:UDP-glucuronate decarboxylase